MRRLSTFNSRTVLFQFFLLLVPGILYFIYFPEVFLQPNSILAGITGDALKNYYTYAYHAVQDTAPLAFKGMQFPFGEHVVYTDCQPLLSGLLRLFPFTHPYVIGILHYLLFFSYIIVPSILFRILKKLNLEDWPAFLFALAISLLAPQFQKISGGHHGLAYGFIIPFTILLCLNTTEHKTWKQYWYLTIYNFSIFFLHPYMGFSVSLLSGLFLLISLFFEKKHSIRIFLFSISPLLLPLGGFKLFMLATDTHGARTAEPFGGKTILENTDGLVAPDFGPFKEVLEKLFPSKIPHLESHAYLGFGVLLLFIFTAGLCLRKARTLKMDTSASSLFLSALLLLSISFGWHQKVLELFHVRSESLNQFRAASRFAWSFYYVLPLFLAVLIRNNWSASSDRLLTFIGAALLLLNLTEAHAYFRKDRDNFWTHRNVLNSALLSPSEKEVIREIKARNCQAIVALPLFHVGSETYARSGADLSMIPAFLYSFHSDVPILGAAMSRTSIKETVASLDLLNSYHNTHAAQAYLNGQPFVILSTQDALGGDEMRLLWHFKPVYQFNKVEIGFMNQGEFLAPKFAAGSVNLNDSLLNRQLIFKETATVSSYQRSAVTDFNTIYKLDSLVLADGIYLVSYLINTKELKEGQGPGLIVARRDQANYRWEQLFSGRSVSGFYKDFQVMEFTVPLSRHSAYEFILQGDHQGFYSIKNFLIHPDTLDTRFKEGEIIYWNNYPINLP